ncbi:MAG: hypothetical protein IPK12_05970 [Gemmatimonadetes bacterium]|nr:hypothetical protein [Gemmatimonadota bacterium]
MLLAACEENAPPAPPPPTYPTRYVLANGGDSSVVMGYRASLTDTLADTVLQHGALWVQPIAPGAIREDAGPACHLGCEVTLRVDLLWQERSFRVVHQLATSGDTVIRFEWPGDTVLADEVPYGGFGARRQGNTRR